MLGPVVLLLQKYGYTPTVVTDATIHIALEKLILDATEKAHLVPAIQELNRMFRLDIKVIQTEMDPEYSGPFCQCLGTNLESRCKLEKCQCYSTQHRWNCSKLGQPRTDFPQEVVSTAITKFSQKVNIEVLEQQLPPLYDWIADPTCCTLCGGAVDLIAVDLKHNACKKCVAATPGKLTRLRLEFLLGNNILTILQYVIKNWHSLQEQAQVLGLDIFQMQELCDTFCLNPKKYRTKNDRRFTNPFFTRKKARAVIDGGLYRLYSKYIVFRQLYKLRPEVKELNNYLLLQANSFLSSRKLMMFNVNCADF